MNLDQSTRFATTIPPINKDSLGVWLADNRWGNFMGSERWREALIMDLGRGNLLFRQLREILHHLRQARRLGWRGARLGRLGVNSPRDPLRRA